MKWAFIFSSYLFSLMLFWCERKMHTTNMYSPNKMLVACTVLTVAKQCWMWKRSTNSFLRNVMIKQHRPSNPNSFTKRKYTHRLCPFQCIVIFHSRSWRVLMVIFFFSLWITYFSVLNWNSEQFLLKKRSYPTRKIKQNAVSDETCDNYTWQKRYIQFNYVGLDFDLDHNAPQ